MVDSPSSQIPDLNVFVGVNSQCRARAGAAGVSANTVSSIAVNPSVNQHTVRNEAEHAGENGEHAGKCELLTATVTPSQISSAF